MSNKNISQYSLLTSPTISTGDFLYLWDVSAGLSYKVYVNDIAGIVPSINNPNNHFTDILVDRYAWISGIIGGQTGTHILSGQYGAILGGVSNVVSGRQCIVGGGNGNTAKGFASFVGAGATNKATGDWSFIGAGRTNLVDGVESAIVAGSTNIVNEIDCFIGGGVTNRIFTDTNVGRSSIVGGDSNQIAAHYASILGGQSNLCSGNWGTVLGGQGNVSSGEYTCTMGQNCRAFPNGATVFGDSTTNTKSAYGPDSFTLNYSGGVWITGGGTNARIGFNLYPTGAAPTASTPGRSGDFAYKDDFLYIFTGDQTDLSNKNWGRVQLSTLNNSPPSVVSNDSVSAYPMNSDYYVTNTFASVPGFSINVPAGNATYELDCIFGVQKGSLCTTIFYQLRNTTDNIMIPNTSGFCKLPTTDAHTQVSIKIITGTNYGAAKTVTLQTYTDVDTSSEAVGHELRVRSTGSSLHAIKLR